MQFLVAASLEAKDFICDIKNSLDEQRQVLDFSAKQQEEVSQFLPLYLFTRIICKPFLSSSLICYYSLFMYSSY